MNRLRFTLDAIDQNARAATIQTARGIIQTPIFMPVGTNASVKSLSSDDITESLNAPIILANTYHLYLRPGHERIEKLGGLHGFSGFKRNFLTDSGGFQAFSLGDNAKVKEEGIAFKSHLDGSKHFFTPEKVVSIQHALNSDIMMVLDDLVALPATPKRLNDSIHRTTRWAQQSLIFHQEVQKEGRALGQNLFAIIQGGTDHLYRQLSAEGLCGLDFDGFAMGGLSVGEANNEMYDTVEFTTPLMPRNKPRYLMGVGTPEDLIENIHRGIDMFDCVMPSRNARNGTLFTTFGKVSIKKAEFALDSQPLDPTCSCVTCRTTSRAYLHHLFRAKELSFFRFATLHNLHYYLTLMRQAREAILSGQWLAFRSEFYRLREQ